MLIHLRKHRRLIVYCSAWRFISKEVGRHYFVAVAQINEKQQTALEKVIFRKRKGALRKELWRSL